MIQENRGGNLRWRAAMALLAAFWICLPSVLQAVGDEFFSRQEIDVPGIVLGWRSADVNGDGKVDLILIADEYAGGRTARVYLQREGDRFPPIASQTVTLSPSTNMVQAADIDGDGKAELLAVDRAGLWAYKHDGTQFSSPPQALAAVPSIFIAGIERCIEPQNLLYPISGRQIAVIPVADGFSLWECRQGKCTSVGQLPVIHKMSQDERPVKLFGSHAGAFVLTLPEIVIADADGDKRDDIYLVWPDRLVIFNQTATGTFGSQPSVDLYVPKAGADFCQSRLADVDRDGRLDLVCSHSIGGISGAHTEIDLYTSDRFTQKHPKETQHVTLTDACGNLIVDNIDRTGGLELVVPAMELGVMTTVKTMITGKTDFHLLIYPIDNLGRPTQEPAVRRKLSCRPGFESANPTSAIRIDWSGDFDGDGLPDVVFADGNGQLQFYRGAAGEYVQSKTSLVLDMIDLDQMQVVSLNADNRSDMIIIHKPGEPNSRVTLLSSNRIN